MLGRIKSSAGGNARKIQFDSSVLKTILPSQLTIELIDSSIPLNESDHTNKNK